MQPITVQTTINVDLSKVWEYYNLPEHVKQWNNASEDWHTTKAENNLKAGGKFTYRMEAKDGSEGFDFSGIYDEVVENSMIKYTMDDGRKVVVSMTDENGSTNVTVTFDPEQENSLELQRSGWQAILDNFKRYVEITE